MGDSKNCHDNDFRGRISWNLFTPLSLSHSEAAHLVYAFCNEGRLSLRGNSRQRKYCSLCRHFHQETEYKDGFEKTLVEKEYKRVKPPSHRRGKLDPISEDANGLSVRGHSLVPQGMNSKSFSLKSRMIHKNESKTNHTNKPTHMEILGKNVRETSSRTKNCIGCEKRSEDFTQESCKSNKKQIKVVVPPLA